MESPNDELQLTETEQKIFDAAHEVFIQRGLDGAKMQDIADRAGINKALLHYYYRSKEKLFEMVAKAVIRRNVPIIRGIINSDLALEEKLEKFINQYIGIISKNAFLPIFLISEMNKHPDRFVDAILPKDLPNPDVFIRQVEEAIAQGRIRPVDPRHLIVNVISMCLMPIVARPMLQAMLAIEPKDWKTFIEARTKVIIDFTFSALRP